jgi:hypothetical protein
MRRLFQKGQPRPAKAGRRAGTPNKATFEIQQACREHGPVMIARLVRMANNPDGHVAIGAIKLLFAYGYGRPRERVVLTGMEGAPLEPKVIFYMPDNARHVNPP